jgi:hypothetical protein
MIFFSLTWSDLLISQANFANFFLNYSRTSSRTVRFGSVQKCISSSSVRFEDFQKCTPLIATALRRQQMVVMKIILITIPKTEAGHWTVDTDFRLCSNRKYIRAVVPDYVFKFP